MQEKITLSVLSVGYSHICFCNRLIEYVFGAPIPGVIYLLLSFIYFLAANPILRKGWSSRYQLAVKIIPGIFTIWFTLGGSDLGDMFD